MSTVSFRALHLCNLGTALTPPASTHPGSKWSFSSPMGCTDRLAAGPASTYPRMGQLLVPRASGRAHWPPAIPTAHLSFPCPIVSKHSAICGLGHMHCPPPSGNRHVGGVGSWELRWWEGGGRMHSPVGQWVKREAWEGGLVIGRGVEGALGTLQKKHLRCVLIGFGAVTSGPKRSGPSSDWLSPILWTRRSLTEGIVYWVLC